MKAIRAVFWSFFGIRRGQDLERDAQSLRPSHLIAAGLAGAALVVAGLVLLVILITR